MECRTEGKFLVLSCQLSVGKLVPTKLRGEQRRNFDAQGVSDVSGLFSVASGQWGSWRGKIKG
jgi:hypothetical protein